MERLVAPLRALALVFALTVGLMGTAKAQIPLPQNDPFYVPPAGYETLANGTVLNDRKIVAEYLLPPLNTSLTSAFGAAATALFPQLTQLQNLKIDAYQVLYKSTDGKGQPVAVAATVLVPHGPWMGSGTRPLVSYQIAEDSLSTSCQPSYTLRTGLLGGSSALGVGTYEVSLSLTALLEGYAIVYADYEGPNSQFIAGMQSAHGVLDGIRAVLHYAPDGLSPSTKVGLWGYSGGGAATGWAAEQKQLYAPELNVVGAAEGGVPSDLKLMLQRNDGSATAGLLIIALVGLDRAYPEAGLYAALNASGRQIFATASDQCTLETAIPYAFTRIENYTTLADPINSTVAEYMYQKNDLGQATPSMPVFNYQDQLDEIVPVDGNNQLTQKYCNAGAQVLTLRTLTAPPLIALVHVAGELAGEPLALGYLNARFNNTAPQLPGMLLPTLNNCPSNIPALINSLPWWDPRRVALAAQPWPWQSY